MNRRNGEVLYHEQLEEERWWEGEGGKRKGEGLGKVCTLTRAVESVVGQQDTRGVLAEVLSVATAPGNTSSSHDSSVCVCVSV